MCVWCGERTHKGANKRVTRDEAETNQDEVVGIVACEGREVDGHASYEGLVELHSELSLAAQVQQRKRPQQDETSLCCTKERAI